MVTRDVRTSTHPLLRDVRWPVLEATGAGDGPRLTLLAGVHGCEYPAIAAVRRFMAGLDTDRLRGSILAVPIVSPTSFTGRSAFVVPEDGRNLNRAFPGDPDGSFTDALADHVFREFIAPAELLIDCHGGDLFEALEPFSIYDGSAPAAAARLAGAYGLPYVVCDRPDGLAGMTSSAAAAAGIPAIVAEVGGCGLLVEDDVRRHLRGLAAALHAAGMLDAPAPSEPVGPQQLVDSFQWLRSGPAGWWQSDVAAGDAFAAGARLGAILDPFGDQLEVITAPADGVVLFVTTSPAVAADGLLLGLGCDLRPLPGAPG